MKFLAVGDLHLDQGPRLGAAPGARLEEQERVWDAALELARDEECAAVLFAGDLVEHRRPRTEAMLAAERPLVRHKREGGCPVIAIQGNHDWAGPDAPTALDVLDQASLLAAYRFPDLLNVTPSGPTSDLSAPGGIAVCLLPWAPVSRLVAAADGGDRTAIFDQAVEMLLSIATGLRARVDGPAILLTHYSISGAATPDGLDVGLFPEPILPLHELEALGFDAIIAGHIHKPQDLATDRVEPMLPVFYTGSPMPLNFGEEACEHGVWLLHSYPIGTRGAIGMSPEFRRLESRRMLTLHYHGDDLAELADVPTTGIHADIEDTLLRLKLSGTAAQLHALDLDAIRLGALDAGAHLVFIDPRVEKQARTRVASITEDLSELQALQHYLAAQGVNGSVGERLLAKAAPYIQAVRS